MIWLNNLSHKISHAFADVTSLIGQTRGLGGTSVLEIQLRGLVSGP